MPRASSMVPRALLVVLLAALLGSARPAVAQRGPAPLSRTQFGIGYVANAPDAVVGGTAYVLLPRAGGIGVFVDAKFDVTDPTSELGWDPDVTAAQVANEISGAKFIKFEESWKTFNVGLLRPLTPSLIAYVGGGIAKLTRYDLYDVDQDDPVGVGGVVWAENPDESATSVNFMAGLMMRLTRRVTTHFGYETKPDGVTVGVSLRIPSW